MKILIYFIASLIMLSIDVQPLGFAIVYYLFALANVGYAVYLITKYKFKDMKKIQTASGDDSWVSGEPVAKEVEQGTDPILDEANSQNSHFNN